MLINTSFFARIRYLSAVLLLSPLAAFSSDFALNGALPDLSSLGLKAPGVAAPAQAKEWTVMIFVNGKNNLEEYAMLDVNEMELAGSTDKVSIAVELGRMNGQHEGDDVSEGGWTGVRRYLIVKDGDKTRIASPVLDHRDKADMGSWKELVDFIQWAKGSYPARRYALILWDHGYGWKPLDPANAPDFTNTKSFSLDDETGHEISTLQLTAALKAVGGVDFLMLDGCNMQMASVAYEVRDLARVLVASEESEPGIVLRYGELMGRLVRKPGQAPEEFGRNAVRIYRDYFTTGGGYSEGTVLTQSAVRLSKVPALREKLDAWVALALNAEKEVLSSAKKNCKAYDDPEFKDLHHFISLVTAGTGNTALKTAGTELARFIRSELVLENWAQDKYSAGMSIYVPDAYDPLYDLLAWSRDGVWDDFARLMATLPPSAPAKPRAPRRR